MKSATGAEALFADALAERPSLPLITFYDDSNGERAELSARSLANWVAKTHFLIVDELGLGPGDTASVVLPADWVTAAILLGCWSAGLCVTRAAEADVTFTDPTGLAGLNPTPEIFVVNLASMSRSFGAAPVPAPATDYVSAVRPQPDSWASVQFRAGAADPATDRMTRAELRAAAIARADELGLAHGARVLYDRPWTEAADWIDALLAPLVVAGSVVLVANADPAKRTRRIEQEQVTAAL